MKKVTILAVALLLLASGVSFGQATSKGDTLIIGPMNSQGQPVGALNEYIAADTTSTGERAHKVYKLLRNQTYILTATVSADFPLVIVADPPDENNRPPIIRSGLKPDGSTVMPLIQAFNDWTLKNVWVSGVAPTGDSNIGWHVLACNGEGTRIVFEGCIFENPYAGWSYVNGYGASHTTYIVKDCIVRNVVQPGGTWAGSFLTHGVIDTVKFINTTFFNVEGPVTTCDEVIGQLYTEVEHCTFVNSVVHQFILNKPVIAKVNNNIFFNCYSFSGGPMEVAAHPDGLIHGIIHMFRFDPAILDSAWGSYYDPDGNGVLEEKERVYELKNNDWWYSDPIKQYWAANDTVYEQTFMNDTVRVHFFEDETGHPWYDEVDTKNVDPQFTDIGNSDELLRQNNEHIRAGAEPVMWAFVPEGQDYLSFTWPLPEKLSYSNAELLTAAEGGFPVGDLNWFPDKKAQWEDWVKTAVEEERPTGVPQSFGLAQNFPNPFNASTTIAFRLSKSAHVRLAVYNSLGQKVASLVDKQMEAGRHTVRFDAGDLPSGVYFYRLEAGDERLQVRKMILLK